MIERHVKKIILLAIVIRLVFAFVIWHPDVRNHIDWGIRFFDYGASEFYAPDANIWSYTWPNQPPGSILIYAGIYKLFLFIFGIIWWVNIKIPIFPSIIATLAESNLYPALLQLPSILADFGIAYLIYKMVFQLSPERHPERSRRISAKLGAALFLINPAIWYNSSVWGQTDAIVNFFGLLSFYYLFKNKLALAILAFAFSIYIKISLLIFAPIFLIIILRKHKFIKILKSTVPSLLALLSITWFFSRTSGKDPISWLYWLYSNKVLTQQLQVITANAFNIWAALTGIHEQPHTLPFLGLTYQYWSYIAFTTFFLPVLYMVYKKQDEKTVVTALALTAFASWSLLTNMHERYLYPLFPYLTILVALNTKLLPTYWTISGINLLNLYHFWWTPRIEPVVKIMSWGDRLTPRILGAVNFGVFIYLYKKFLKVKSRS
jgi:hypothetical protein